jgi:cytochrome b involved in lipid metabolism
MNVKNELIIGIAGSVLIIFLTIFYSNQYKKQREQFNKIAPANNITQSSSNSNNVLSNVSLTNNEVAKHNSVNDCWIIIQGSVYNVTQYLSLHPGGSDRIIPFCGQDATSAYATKGGNGTHSSQADADLSKLKLGQLNETVNITNTGNQIKNNINLINSSGRKNKYDD